MDDALIRMQLSHGDERADPQPRFGANYFMHVLVADRGDVDKRARLHHFQLHQVDQGGTAAQELNTRSDVSTCRN